MHIYIHAYIYLYIYIYLCIYIYMYTYIYIYTKIFARAPRAFDSLIVHDLAQDPLDIILE